MQRSLAWRFSRLAIFMMVVLLEFAVAGLEHPAFAQSEVAAALPREDLESFFDDLIPAQLAQRNVPGAAVAVVDPDGLRFARGYGLADIDNRQPVDVETTLFHVGSTAKLITWTAVMQQIERSVLDPNTDINNYLDFAIPDTFPAPITLNHLMSHTAGFENRDFGWLARDPESVMPLGAWLAQNVPGRVRPAGSEAGYSNYGAALAGYIVERATGLPYEAYVEWHILQPLGMTSSTARQQVPADLAARMAHGYALIDGELKKQTLSPYQGVPAGTLRATAPDIARFMQAHLRNGLVGDYQMLSHATAITMRQTLFRFDPRVNGMAHGFMEMDRNGERIVGHIGSAAPLYYSVLSMFPDRGIGLFVVYNADSARPLTVGNEMLDAFVDRFFPVTAVPQIDGSAERVSQYVGDYRRNNFGGSYTTVEKLGRLLSSTTNRRVSNPGDGTLEIRSGIFGTARFAERDVDFFQELGGQDAVFFRRDADGRVNGAVFGSEPIYTFELVSLVESVMFNAALLGFSLVAFVTALVTAAISCIRSLLGRAPHARHDLAAVARLVAAVLVVVNLVFLLGLAVALGDSGPVMGDYSHLRVLLLLPLLCSGLTVLAVALTALAWRRGFWSVPARLHYTYVVLGVVAFLWFASTWNLLGVRL